MRICERLARTEPFSGRLSLTIGNFEGYHRGHQEIIQTLVGASRSRGLYAAVITFNQHPIAVLSRREPERLWSQTDKIVCFQRAGIDLLISLDFTPEFALNTPRAFLDLLVNTLSPRILCLGNNFRFGRGNAGTVEFLREASAEHYFALITVDDFMIDGAPVSSTRTREAVKKGNIQLATNLLGRRYSVHLIPLEGSGRVLVPFIEHSAVPSRGWFRGEMEETESGGKVACRVRIEHKLFFPDTAEGFEPGRLYRFSFERAEREEK